MDRFLMKKLVAWKINRNRKPLILNGARQVGKTWLLKEFGRQYFTNAAYINLDNNPRMMSQFDLDFNTERLLLAFEVETGEQIVPGKTLIILDEIQECPKALTSLKYFSENAPEQMIVAAGSLLGITIHAGSGYPVGKVDSMDLYPLNFREFLEATGNTNLRKLIDGKDSKQIEVAESFSTKLIPLLKQYYFVGGMPEVVKIFLDTNNFDEVRRTQQNILQGYERDISKHMTASEIEYTLAAWNSIPAHLAQENKKFIFGHIKKGARAREYRSAITWLSQAGLATRVTRISGPGIPLSGYAQDNVFKLFLLDVGLLGAMVGLDPSSMLDSRTIFTGFKGALTEQYVCQQLISDGGFTPFYWSADNSRGEIDFIVQKGSDIFPIEVAAEENLRSKSLRAFTDKYTGMHPLRFSLSPFKDRAWMRNIPLYECTNVNLWK